MEVLDKASLELELGAMVMVTLKMKVETLIKLSLEVLVGWP